MDSASFGLHGLRRIMGDMASTRTRPSMNDGLPAAGANDDPSDAPLPSDATSVDLHRIERAVREILLAIGEDPQREGLLQTPSRVARAYAELMAGMNEEPRRHLKT